MKKLYVCQIVDKASESIIATFTAPTHRYFDRQMENFFEDCKKKSIPVEDFEGFIVACVDVCESFNDAVSFLEDNDAYTYLGVSYMALKNQEGVN